MRNLLYLLFVLIVIPVLSYSQSTIKGTVKDKKGNPVPFANVFIKHSTEGAATDTGGHFVLKTNRKGNDTLIVSSVGYTQLAYPLVLKNEEITVSLVIRENASTLGEVVINAGTIQASNDRTVAMLTPLDIVTTAGGKGDIIGAIQALPGVQTNGGDQTGLMVRGGDVNESAVIIDGTVAQNPFYTGVPGVAQRSRFNPFQFKGTAFSSGGYSVKYGEALSSVLDLETTDLPEKSNVDMGLNFSGVQVAGTKLMGNNAIEFSGNYSNLYPYFLIAKTNFDFYDIPHGWGFSTRWLSKVGDKGMFKMNLQQGFTNEGVQVPDPGNYGSLVNYGVKNANTFFNSSYTQWVTDGLKLFGAISYSNNTNDINWSIYNQHENDSRLQGRAEVYYEVNRKFSLLAGTEFQDINETRKLDTIFGNYEETQISPYLETEWKPIRWFGVKAGLRGEYDLLLKKGNLGPRISLAFKTGKYSQISLASGIFYQAAASQYLVNGYTPDFQKAIHYLLNFQLIKDDRTFRIEGYYKDYAQLVRELGLPYDPNPYRFSYGMLDNSGYGYARGADVFWRDEKTIKNLDYWISYSYIDTKRLYENYISLATPDYVSNHNLNVIVKYFIEPIQVNISLTYTYASGRSYYNPLSTGFLTDKSPDYQNLAMGFSYLTTFKNWFTVFYLSLDNVANIHNILGYRYSTDGKQRYPILPPAYRTIFFGVNISLTKFKKDEL
jgi:hypothetical protein